MAKQQKCQIFVLKIHSKRLRRSNWNLTLPLSDARKNDEIISLSDSQTMTFIDEINNVTDADVAAKEIKRKIKRIRKEPNSFKNKKEMRNLYNKLDDIQFKSDYICVIMDSVKDYLRACQGFSVNGVRYERLLGTNGGVKNETIVFVSAGVAAPLKEKIENGRDRSVPLVPGKLEAYKALSCSGSIPVSFPDGIIVVDDCMTKFKSDVIEVKNTDSGEPLVSPRENVDIELNASDGFGLMCPELAKKWSEELGLDYTASGMNTRFAWEKGMVFCFDFREFAENVAHKTIIKDAWGNDADITKAQLILTTSMVKLWDSYKSCEDYMECSKKNGYTFRITKTCPKELENERNLNYQFIQSYELSDEDIDELITPTVNEIRDILSGDYKKTILFLKGKYLDERSVSGMSNDFVKALMIDKNMMDDPFVQHKVYQMIKKRIDEAKVGVLKVHGNYSIVSGDPYSLCQSMFGLEVTGLLKAGEIYNKYWADRDVETLACYRAPMTSHNNIRRVNVTRSDEINHWYRYMTTCTIFNSWDTMTQALNGCDFDGDLVMLTDNRVLLDNLKDMPAIMCEQKRADKMIVKEEDLIKANINSFGDEIGKITNRITSMFEIQSHFSKDSEEYKELEYRIRCGQLFQQDSIDKVKGIIAKPMPPAWYDRKAVKKMDTSSPSNKKKHKMCLSILADKKPYFMTYIYPALKKDYNEYIKNTNKKCIREFRQPLADIVNKPDKTPEEDAFVKYYYHRMPVGIGDCVMNKICRKIESAFDDILKSGGSKTTFDYSMLKSDEEYCNAQYNSIVLLYKDYVKQTQDYMQYAMSERVDEDESASQRGLMVHNFKRECRMVCPDATKLCNIIVDICYRRNCSKQFAWDICGREIIENLLAKNNNTIYYPASDPDGDIVFGGDRFSLRSKVIGGETLSA